MKNTNANNNSIDYQAILQAVPDLYLILNPSFDIVAVSDAYLAATMVKREDILGRNIFEVFPDNPSDPHATGVKNLRASLERVLEKKITDVMAVQKYDIRRPATEGGEFEERYWSPKNSPVFGKDQTLKYIIHRVEDVSAFVHLKQLGNEKEIEAYQRTQQLADVNDRLQLVNEELADSKSALLKVNKQFRLLVESSKDYAIIMLDPEGNIALWNAGAEHITGYSADEIIGQHFSCFFTKEAIKAHHPEQELKIALKEGRYEEEGWRVRKNGERYWANIVITPIYDEKNILIGFGKITRDLTLHKKNEMLEARSEKMKLLTELSDTTYACKSIDEVTEAVSIYANRILNFTKGVLYLKNEEQNILEAKTFWGDIAKIQQIFRPDECWALRRGHLHKVSSTQPSMHCNHVNIIKSQEKTLHFCLPLMAQNHIYGLLYLEFVNGDSAAAENNLMLMPVVAETVSLALANVSLRELLQNQSTHDSLTGLFNRRFLDECLATRIEQASKENINFALIMFDIDYFKQLNDQYGHEVGDLVLKILSDLFQKETRSDDVVCRYGGEEFLCILWDCELTSALKRANELRHKINQTVIMVASQKIPAVTISGGVVAFPIDGNDSKTLLDKADKALYAAKRSGKNKVLTYDAQNLAHNKN